MNGTAPTRKPRRLLPPLELEVMKVLWERGETNVREVQVALQPDRPLAYTTVMTLLERLHRKGAVTRRKQGRGFHYRPMLEREAALDLALNRLVRDFFRSSRHDLLAYLQEHPAAPEEEEQTEELDSVLL